MRGELLLRFPYTNGKLIPGDAVLQRPLGSFLKPIVLHQHLHQLNLQLGVVLHDILHKHVSLMSGNTVTPSESGTDTHLNVVAPVLFRHAFLRKKWIPANAVQWKKRRKHAITDENKQNFGSQVHHYILIVL